MGEMLNLSVKTLMSVQTHIRCFSKISAMVGDFSPGMKVMKYELDVTS